MIRVLGYVSHRVSAQHYWAAVALSAAALSLAWTPNPGWAGVHLFSLALAYILGTWIVPQLPWAIYGGLVALTPLIYLIGKPNPTMLATAAALGFAGAVVYKLWPLMISNLAIMFCFPARAPAIALGVFAIGWVWRYNKAISFLLVFTAIGIFCLKSYDSGASVYQRLGIWQDTFDHLTILGSGFGSFANAYASWGIHRNAIGNIIQTAPHAYSDPLELVFELGVASIAIWSMLVYAIATGTREFRLIALTFAILSIAYFPLYIPVVGHIFMFALGGAEEDKWGDGYVKA